MKLPTVDIPRRQFLPRGPRYHDNVYNNNITTAQQYKQLRAWPAEELKRIMFLKKKKKKK